MLGLRHLNAVPSPTHDATLYGSERVEPSESILFSKSLHRARSSDSCVLCVRSVSAAISTATHRRELHRGSLFVSCCCVSSFARTGMHTVLRQAQYVGLQAHFPSVQQLGWLTRFQSTATVCSSCSWGSAFDSSRILRGHLTFCQLLS